MLLHLTGGRLLRFSNAQLEGEEVGYQAWLWQWATHICHVLAAIGTGGGDTGELQNSNSLISLWMLMNYGFWMYVTCSSTFSTALQRKKDVYTHCENIPPMDSWCATGSCQVTWMARLQWFWTSWWHKSRCTTPSGPGFHLHMSPCFSVLRTSKAWTCCPRNQNAKEYGFDSMVDMYSCPCWDTLEFETFSRYVGGSHGTV